MATSHRLTFRAVDPGASLTASPVTMGAASDSTTYYRHELGATQQLLTSSSGPSPACAERSSPAVRGQGGHKRSKGSQRLEFSAIIQRGVRLATSIMAAYVDAVSWRDSSGSILHHGSRMMVEGAGGWFPCCSPAVPLLCGDKAGASAALER
jgi:hypothetical protein